MTSYLLYIVSVIVIVIRITYCYMKWLAIDVAGTLESFHNNINT